jgi:hypothetical protein
MELSSWEAVIQLPTISSLFVPNILLSTLFSNTLRLCSSFNVRNQVSHPYKTTWKNYSSAYFNFCVFRQQTRRQSVLNIQPALNFLINQILTCYYRSKNLNFSKIFKGSISSIYVIILKEGGKEREKSNWNSFEDFGAVTCEWIDRHTKKQGLVMHS